MLKKYWTYFVGFIAVFGMLVGFYSDLKTIYSDIFDRKEPVEPYANLSFEDTIRFASKQVLKILPANDTGFDSYSIEQFNSNPDAIKFEYGGFAKDFSSKCTAILDAERPKGAIGHNYLWYIDFTEIDLDETKFDKEDNIISIQAHSSTIPADHYIWKVSENSNIAVVRNFLDSATQAQTLYLYFQNYEHSKEAASTLYKALIHAARVCGSVKVENKF